MEQLGAGSADSLRERVKGPSYELRALAREVHQLITEEHFEEALEIVDALILVVDAPLHFYCNALWVTMEANTGIPLSPKRARRALMAALTWARANPEIYLNAAFVFLELGEHERAVQHLMLAKQHDVDLSAHLREPACEAIRAHESWSQLEGEQTSSAVPIPWTTLVSEAVLRGDFAGATPVLLSEWRDTRHPRLADALDRIAFSTEERAGYRAHEVERCLREAPLELAASTRAGTRWRVEGDEKGDEDAWLSLPLDDPRFSAALIRTLRERTKFPTEKRVEYGWFALLKNIAAARDTRIVAPLRRLAEQAFRWFPNAMAPQIAGAMRAAADRIERHTPPELDDATSDCLSLLESRLPEPPAAFDIEQKLPPPPHEASETDPLLAMWRRTRSTRIANLLEVRGDALPPYEADIRALDQGWDAFESNADVGAHDAAQILWGLRKSPHDPRVTGELCKLLKDAPFRYPFNDDNGVTHYWEELFATIGTYEDVRPLPRLRSLLDEVHAFCKKADDWSDAEMYTTHRLSVLLVPHLLATIAALESLSPTKLTQADEASLSALELKYADALASLRSEEEQAKAHAGTRARLLDAVLRSPASDEARVEYAAHLEMLGDPHGEFIRLQLSGEDAARQEALKEEHGAAFMGPLARVLEHASFERGFPVAATTKAFNIRREPYEGPLLATLETLRFDLLAWPGNPEKIGAPIDTFVLSPHFRSLRELTKVRADAFVRLVEGGLVQLESVSFDIASHRNVDWPAVHAALRACPGLKTVKADIYSAQTFDAVAPLLDSGLRIKGIEYVIRETDRIKNWSVFAARWWASSFAELYVSTHSASFRFAREDSSLVVQQCTGEFGVLLNALLCLPKGTFHVFTLEFEAGVSIGEHQKRLLEAALERFDLQQTTLPNATLAEDKCQALKEGRPSLEALCERAPRDKFAIGALGYLRAEQAVPTLSSILQKGRRDEAMAAAEALARIGSRKPLPALRQLVHDSLEVGDEGPAPKRWAALEALGRLEDRAALPLLRRAFEEGQFTDKRAATIAFGRIGEDQDILRIEKMSENRQFRPHFLIALVARAPSRLQNAAAAIADGLDGWERSLHREALVELLIVIAGHPFSTDTASARELLRLAITEQIHAWRAMSHSALIDSFRPGDAWFLGLVDRLEAAWSSDGGSSMPAPIPGKISRG